MRLLGILEPTSRCLFAPTSRTSSSCAIFMIETPATTSQVGLAVWDIASEIVVEAWAREITSSGKYSQKQPQSASGCTSYMEGNTSGVMQFASRTGNQALVHILLQETAPSIYHETANSIWPCNNQKQPGNREQDFERWNSKMSGSHKTTRMSTPNDLFDQDEAPS